MNQVLPGICPVYLRVVTSEKFGLKNGAEYVDFKFIPKCDILNHIQTLGVMSDWHPAKRQIESYSGEEILVVFDRTLRYGEYQLI